ncbi:hypothetical protein [Sphingopyxis sp. MWB1]|uniref:hypothetical protein n=1 Tax=Sphingopyxis sp. MWB1 TaxID=1537715 RepID=UPI0006917650|nr:hypothetical protein [Sphingopyxis sp. MWB1]
MRARANAPRAGTLWITLFTGASTATTLLLACATPFPSLAALAATHMRFRDGMLLMLLAWAVSQIVGFGLHDYPRDWSTLCWGVGLGTAALASAGGAYAALRHVQLRSMAARLAVAYGAAFVAFKLVVAAWALVLGGLEITLAPELLLKQGLRNGAILIGLFLLYRTLVAAGVPALPRPSPLVIRAAAA